MPSRGTMEKATADPAVVQPTPGPHPEALAKRASKEAPRPCSDKDHEARAATAVRPSRLPFDKLRVALQDQDRRGRCVLTAAPAPAQA